MENLQLQAEIARLKAELEEANARAAVCLNFVKGTQMAMDGQITEEQFTNLLNSFESDLARAAKWFSDYQGVAVKQLAGELELRRPRPMSDPNTPKGPQDGYFLVWNGLNWKVMRRETPRTWRALSGQVERMETDGIFTWYWMPLPPDPVPESGVQRGR